MRNSVVALHSLGHSIRQIASQLGLNRRTVRRYIGAPGTDPPSSKCTTPALEVAAGSEGSGAAKCTTPSPKVAAGSEGSGGPKCTTPAPKVAAGSEGSGAAKCTASAPKVAVGSKSRCEPWRAVIEASIEAGLTAERIWQDLRSAHGFEGAYNSVKRFVTTLRSHQPRRVQRMECEPGEELQVDFMQGPMLPDPDKPSKRRRCWILCAVLSCSRKGYSEAVWRQDTESFLRAVENALRAFGGVPVLLNLDNLRAAVKRADWFDPEFNPKFADFCRHYGITPMPCRPYTPQHKGKVERNVQYVRHNALAGHGFAALGELNAHLRQWEASVADTRIHGTTRRQVGEHFTAVERPALKPLPLELFPAYTEAKRIVGRDGYVEVAKAYYMAPPEFIGRSVWVRSDGRQVRIFNQKMEQIASHTRVEPGRYSSVRGVRGLDHAGPLQSTVRYWQSRVEAIGPAAARWAQRAATERGAEALRSFMGLCALLKKHRASHLEQACVQALEHAGSGNPALRAIRQHLLAQQPSTQPSPSHPLIRELFVYGQFIQANATNANATNTNATTNATNNTNTTNANVDATNTKASATNTNFTNTNNTNPYEPPQHPEDPSPQTAPQHPCHQP